jgi:hypothetical protein
LKNAFVDNMALLEVKVERVVAYMADLKKTAELLKKRRYPSKVYKKFSKLATIIGRQLDVALGLDKVGRQY